MKIFNKRNIALWTQQLLNWLDAKFSAISIDLTPVEEKLDEVKGNVADVKTAVEHIDFSTLAKEQTLTTGLQTVLTALYPKATSEQLTDATAAILNAISHIDIDTSNLAKEATLGTSSDTSVSTTVFGWLKSIRDFIVGIVTTYPYAKESTLGTPTDAASDATVFGKLKEIKDKIETQAIDRAATINRGGDLGAYIVFFDIDGTILYSYTAEEIYSLNELPKPYVKHEGLTFDRWSWTLEELKADLSWHDVGAHYYPTDGYGQLELDYRDSKTMLTPHIGVKMRTSDGLIVDWGDGTIETLPAALEFDLQHTYAQAGKYLMKYKQANDAKIYGIYVWEDTKKHVVGRCVYPTNAECISCSPLTGQTENTNRSDQQGIAGTLIEELAIPYSCCLDDANFSCGLHGNMPLLRAFSGQFSHGGSRGMEKNSVFTNVIFASINPSNGQIKPKHTPFNVRSYEIRADALVYSNNIERYKNSGTIKPIIYSSATGYLKNFAPKLKNFNFTFSTYSENGVGGCSMPLIETPPIVPRTIFPWGWKVSFSNCYKIRDWGMEVSDTSGVSTNIFENNYSLRTVTIVAKGLVTANMFLNCYSLEEVHVKTSVVEHGSISTLNNINAFSGCPSYMKIYVPADSVNDYKAATNWATYANQIFAEPTT